MSIDLAGQKMEPARFHTYVRNSEYVLFRKYTLILQLGILTESHMQENSFGFSYVHQITEDCCSLGCCAV